MLHGPRELGQRGDGGEEPAVTSLAELEKKAITDGNVYRRHGDHGGDKLFTILSRIICSRTIADFGDLITTFNDAISALLPSYHFRINHNVSKVIEAVLF